MSKKLVQLWTKFVADSAPDPRWKQLTKDDEEVKYAVLDDKPVRMAMDHEFKEV